MLSKAQSSTLDDTDQRAQTHTTNHPNCQAVTGTTKLNSVLKAQAAKPEGVKPNKSCACRMVTCGASSVYCKYSVSAVCWSVVVGNKDVCCVGQR